MLSKQKVSRDWEVYISFFLEVEVWFKVTAIWVMVFVVKLLEIAVQ